MSQDCGDRDLSGLLGEGEGERKWKICWENVQEKSIYGSLVAPVSVTSDLEYDDKVKENC